MLLLPVHHGLGEERSVGIFLGGLLVSGHIDDNVIGFVVFVVFDVVVDVVDIDIKLGGRDNSGCGWLLVAIGDVVVFPIVVAVVLIKRR